MITDEIMELLEMMTSLLEGTAYAQGIDCAKEALSDFDGFIWAEMSDDDKKTFLRDAIRRHIEVRP